MRRMLFVVITAVACAREQDEPPAQDETGSADDDGDDDGDDDDGTGMTADDDADDDDGPTDPSGIDSSDDDGGSETGVDCEGPDGCWNCAPTDPMQILNACTDSQCDAFSNTADRLPLLERDGSLPPIP